MEDPAYWFADKHPARYLVLGVISAGLALLIWKSWLIALSAFFIGPGAISWLAWAVAPLFRKGDGGNPPG